MWSCPPLPTTVAVVAAMMRPDISFSTHPDGPGVAALAGGAGSLGPDGAPRRQQQHRQHQQHQQQWQQKEQQQSGDRSDLRDSFPAGASHMGASELEDSHIAGRVGASSPKLDLKTTTQHVSKVRSSTVRDYLLQNLARESARQRKFDRERWVYLEAHNSRTRHQWLAQLETQMQDARLKLEQRANPMIIPTDGRPYTGFQLSSSRHQPSALQGMRVNSKFKLQATKVAEGKAAARLFDLSRGHGKLYHVPPETVRDTRGKVPEISASQIPVLDANEIRREMRRRDAAQSLDDDTGSAGARAHDHPRGRRSVAARNADRGPVPVPVPVPVAAAPERVGTSSNELSTLQRSMRLRMSPPPGTSPHQRPTPRTHQGSTGVGATSPRADQQSQGTHVVTQDDPRSRDSHFGDVEQLPMGMPIPATSPRSIDMPAKQQVDQLNEEHAIEGTAAPVAGLDSEQAASSELAPELEPWPELFAEDGDTIDIDLPVSLSPGHAETDVAFAPDLVNGDVGEPDENAHDESIDASNSPLNVSDGTIQLVDASNAISAILDAAEARAAGTPEKKGQVLPPVHIAALSPARNASPETPPRRSGVAAAATPASRPGARPGNDTLFNDDEDHVEVNAELSVLSGMSREATSTANATFADFDGSSMSVDVSAIESLESEILSNVSVLTS